MLPADRLDYSPISERAPLKLPDGARTVVVEIFGRDVQRVRKAEPEQAVDEAPADGDSVRVVHLVERGDVEGLAEKGGELGRRRRLGERRDQDVGLLGAGSRGQVTDKGAQLVHGQEV